MNRRRPLLPPDKAVGQTGSRRIAALERLANPEYRPVVVNEDDHEDAEWWPQYDHMPDLRDTIRALELSTPESEGPGVPVRGDPWRICAHVGNALNVISDPAKFASRLFELYVALDRQKKPGTITVPRYVPRGTHVRYPSNDVLCFKLEIDAEMDDELEDSYIQAVVPELGHRAPRAHLDQLDWIEANFRIVGGDTSAMHIEEGHEPSLAERLGWLLRNHPHQITLELDTDRGYIATGPDAERHLKIYERTFLDGTMGMHATHWNTFPGRTYLVYCAFNAMEDSLLMSHALTEGEPAVLRQGFVDLGV